MVAFVKRIGSIYSGSRFSEIEEPHPQPPPRKRGGGYDISHVIRKRYKTNRIPLVPQGGIQNSK